MVAWVNRTVAQAPRNGTTSHTVAFAPASAGNLLVAVVEGAVTSTTPTGWTLPASGSAVNESGLYVWRKTATAGEASFTTTHNASNYPVVAAVYEFPAGSTFVKSVSVTGLGNSAANPNLTALTGTNLVAGVKAAARASGRTYTDTVWSGTGSPVKDVAVSEAYSTTDGYVLSVAFVEGFTGTAWQPTGSVSGSSYSSEALTFAVNVPAGGGSFAVSGSVVSASSVSGSVTSRRGVSGVVVSGSAVVGAVTVSRPAQGIVGSASTVSGAVHAILSVSGAVESSSTVAGQVTKISSVSGMVAIVSDTTGAVSARYAVSGATGSASDAQGAVTALFTVAGVANSTSAVTGTLDGEGNISGVIASTSSVHGSVTAIYSVSGTVASATHVAGMLDIKGGLSGTIGSSSDAFGAVTVIMQVTGLVESSSVVRGAVRKDEPKTGPLTLTITMQALTITGEIPVLTLTATAPELTLTSIPPTLTLEVE